MSTIKTNVVSKSFSTRMSVDSYFIIAFIIIISPFLLIFFWTYLSLCERLSRLCHVPRAATLTTICSFFAKCAATGGKRNSQNFPTSNISVDLQAIDNRLEQLKSASLQSTYSKQKCSLRTQFGKFLASLPNTKTILSASPTGINRFLAWNDRHG